MMKYVHRNKTGRPVGSPTRLRGLCQFCRDSGYSVVYAHEILTGKRCGGAPLRRAWAMHWAGKQGGAK
jgi:hypothetical protein